MNAAENFRLRTQALVARGLGSAAVAGETGLRAASEVWGGDEPRELPAWYLWLDAGPGAYQLELAEAGPLEPLPGAVVGRFVVRYYPSPAEPDFPSFAPEEQEAARAWMDASGAPHIERAAAIPASWFTVGSVDWALDPERGTSALALGSLDRLRLVEEAGQRLVRDVPGWRHTAAVFSALAGLHARLDRLAASRLLLGRRPGFELVRSAGVLGDRPSAEAVQGEAILLLCPAGGAAEDGARLLGALRDPEAEQIADEPIRPDRHPHELSADPRLRLRLRHAWFGGEAPREDRIACAC